MNKSILLFCMLFIFCSKQESSLISASKDVVITLPEGFKAVVVADNLGRSRHLAINDNGDIYVRLQKGVDGKGIAALRDTDGDGKADEIKYFEETTGTGMEIYKGYLYFSTPTSIQRYKLDGKLVPSYEPEVIVNGFPEQGTHNSKPFTFDKKGNMYVTVGAPSNACQESPRTPGSPGIDPCPQLEKQAGIWRFKAEETGQTQDDGTCYATGIRNAVAICWNPIVDNLYIVQHGRDQLSQLWPEYYTDEDNAELPAEEFLLVNEGSNFGWPYSYYNHLLRKKMLAPEYGGDGKKEARSKDFEDPILAFPGHFAPNDLLFYNGNQFPDKYRNGAFIAFHGSWNRAPLEQKGYQVAFVPFEGKEPSGDWEVFANGFKGADSIISSGQAKYRPCGLALGNDGSIYISDSVMGKLWRVFYK